MTEDERPLWSPDGGTMADAQVASFVRFCSDRSGVPLLDWPALHAWSIADVGRFWSYFIEWMGLSVDGGPEPATVGEGIEATRFFPNLRLSFAEIVLDGRGANGGTAAVVQCHEDLPARVITRAALRSAAACGAAALETLGVRVGDRVAAIAAHDADTIATSLAVTGLGAAWSSCGPELATEAVVARFEQLDAPLLVVSGEHVSDGYVHRHAAKAAAVAAALPSIKRVLCIGRGREAAATAINDALGRDIAEALELWSDGANPRASWPRLPFDHPLYVLYSSGTTGAPKAIVHGAGGTLLEHLKEHILHGDLRADDRLYFQTTCGWMMWHWTVSALATGAAIVTYDGSISAPGPDALWRLAADTRVTRLGASPAFVHHSRGLQVQPEAHDLSALRAFLSTGSVLADGDYDWLIDRVGPIPIQSISGGTDIIGCFVLGSPWLPVWRGESQCISLAMDVRALATPAGGPDELVCATPFPSRPVAFLRDPEGRRMRDTYYSQNPGLWTHGDFVSIHPRGSVRILGRSDGVLKVRGVRIGPVEITQIADSLPEVRESMAVEQRVPHEVGGSRIVLLVVLQAGATLDRGLTWRLKRAIRDATSRDHVPSVIAEVPDLPRTLNNKRSERAARDAVNGDPVVNRDALVNPAVLDLLRAHPALSR